MGEADCKEEVIIRINGDNHSDEKWCETYSDVLNGIGSKLKNDEWAKTFQLFTMDDNALVDNSSKFITAVKQRLLQNNKATFCIKVGVFVFFFLFLYFFGGLCFFCLLQKYNYFL